MIIKETTDQDVIKSVMHHPEIYPHISDDPPTTHDLPINDGVQYLAGFVDGHVIGIVLLIDVEDKVKCHIQVLPEYREKYAKPFAKACFKLGKAVGASIYGHIPKRYPNVIEFGKAVGFYEDGTINDNVILRYQNGSL